MEKGWNGLPFKPISEHYTQLFGCKVYKIPVATVDDCPNRMGLKGMQTCAFCDVWGSAARSEAFDMSLTEQIKKYKRHIQEKYKAKKFLVYFQAYTNTFTKISDLEKNFALALEQEDVLGCVIGTRPDCLSPAVLKLWQKYHEQAFVAVELGVQSFYDEHLIKMRRGHDVKCSRRALEILKDQTSIDVGIHLIFGNPNETKTHILQSALWTNELAVTNVKLHNLHVLKNTHLEQQFQQGVFTPIDRETYAEYVKIYIENLRPDIALHRLSAFASRPEELVSPAWTARKMETHQYLVDYLRARESFQGKEYLTLDPHLIDCRENRQSLAAKDPGPMSKKIV